LFAAEISASVVRYAAALDASMRPQLFAAEIVASSHLSIAVRIASMRPQLFAAEIIARWQPTSPTWRSFNEAAAIRCGDRADPGRAHCLRGASMRPQLFAAEIKGAPRYRTRFDARLQ